MFGEKSQYLVILSVVAALVFLDIRFNFSNDLGCTTTRATPRAVMLTTSASASGTIAPLVQERLPRAASCSTSGKSRSGKTITRFFVQLLNTKLVVEQLRNLHFFVSDAFEYHMVDGATDPKIKAQIKALADGSCTFYHSCPASSLAHCLNHATQRVISKFTDGFAIHLNVDMFLLKPWSTAAYFARYSNPAVMAVIEDHGHNGGQPVLGYLHPNLLMINTNVANAQLAHMRFDAEAGTDTGGATRAFMQKHPELKLMPLMWSRHFDVRALHAVGLIAAEVEAMMLHEQETRGIMAADLYASDFSWFHLRDSTCWSGSAACVARSKQLETNVWPVVNAQLAGRNLTYQPLAYDQQWWQRLNHFHQGSCTSGEPMTPGRGDVSPEGFLLEFPPGACLASLEEQARYACFIKKNIVIPKGAPIVATAAAVPSQAAATKPKYGFNSDAWMGDLYRAVDAMRVKVRAKIAAIQASGRKLPLPTPQTPPARTNLHLRPIRYAQPQFARDSSYYWRYVYDGSPGQDLPAPEGVCTKKPGQKYWGLTFAIGPVRQKIGREHTVPSCLHHGVDEMVMMTEEDFDEDFKSRNKETLATDKGKV